LLAARFTAPDRGLSSDVISCSIASASYIILSRCIDSSNELTVTDKVPPSLTTPFELTIRPASPVCTNAAPPGDAAVHCRLSRRIAPPFALPQMTQFCGSGDGGGVGEGGGVGCGGAVAGKQASLQLACI
jgi:hypothetical protein